MKHSLLASILLATTAAVAQEKPKPIMLNELQERGIAGELGLPLGTVCEIDATIIDGDEIGPKRFWSTYLLKVHSVNGVPVKEERELAFRNSDEDHEASLPSLYFKSYEQTYKKPARWLSDKGMTEVEKGYVGSRHRRLVYETGQFQGLPRNMPGPPRAGYGFGFFTKLVILGELPPDGLGK